MQHELVRSLVHEHIHTLEIPIRFEFMYHDYRGPSTIRITFITSGHSRSNIGLRASHGSADDYTMRLNLKGDSNWNQRRILHEFGHALGLEHQHQHPDSGIDWNLTELKRRFKEQRIRRSFLPKIERLRSVPYDRDSVMHYPIDKDLTNNLCRSIPLNIVLSEGDKKLLRSMYHRQPALAGARGV
ncbi:hypothetical protein PG996_004939 [Apiospora saccharicola]|uniref:Metalloendopeptidase n=1 Tax=Apiospora saccharicola TaxID=335842 RepID=A0ABR1VK32_9PEZI